MKCAILVIGSEVLDGRVQDTNSNFLCAKLGAIGINVSHVLACTDKIDQIKELIEFARQKAQVVIISGGLGPTSDDLTREAVSEYFGRKLVLSEKALQEMKELYKKRGRNFNPINEKQALFPLDSMIIPNPVGTAPGFLIHERKDESDFILVCLPGVPVELTGMYAETVEDYLKEHLKLTPINVKGFRCFGLPEAAIGEAIERLKIPPEIFVSYRAAFPEVHVALKSDSSETEKYHSLAMEVVGKDYILTTDLNLNFEELILNLLKERAQTISTAESCTGGMLASILTKTPGSSDAYLGSVVAYANSVKNTILGVAPETISAHGAVSAETALEMAVSCRQRLATDYALSITGIAGPSRGASSKPVGLYYVGIADKDGASAHRHFLPLKRRQIILHASYMALDVLRRKLLSLPPLPDAVLPEPDLSE